MYKARSYAEILSELKTLYGSEIIEGTFAFDILSSNAIEFGKMEVELAEAYKNAFADTAAVEYLELRCSEAGLSRKAAKAAQGEILIKGSGTIPANTIFQTAGKEQFYTTESAEVEGSGTVKISAVKAGAAGNVAANTITIMPLNLPGVESVTNLSATFDGYDAESDDSLRKRYLWKVRQQPTSGNPANYISWATSIVGVGTARVQRCPQGRGTVRVIIADENLDAPNELLLQRVKDYIEEMRPVGVEVFTEPAEIIPVNVNAKIYGALNVDAFKTATNAYFVTLIQDQLFSYTGITEYENLNYVGYVPLAQISSFLIKEGGADDVKQLQLNGAAADIPLTIQQIPKLGECTFY